MARNSLHSLFCGFLLALSVLSCHCQEVERKVHVVYMGEAPKGGLSVASTHQSMLQNVLGSSSAKDSLVYSYGRSFNGFAAKLSDEEAAKFSEMEGVVSVMPNTKLKLHTTRSWDFMGLSRGDVDYSPQGADVIVGLLDTGIWPEAESFSDEEFGPPPAKWKGKCQTAENFTCNNKLIGARFYNSDDDYDVTDFKSPRDSEGHGTHTSSTAAGGEVANVSFFGLAPGVARGAVPQARIAMYKVCWSSGCSVADILAAFDDAIADGVDIISVSLGFDFPLQYFQDPIAIGAFHAMKNGIVTSNSAGNSGPYPRSVSNYSPWSITVAASSIDRKFVSQVVLGNGLLLNGNAINTFELVGSTLPLIYGGDAPNVSAGFSGEISRYCEEGTLNSYMVEGKIVLCDEIGDGSGVLDAKGLGNIMNDPDYSDLAFSYPLPSTLLTPDDGQKVLQYIKSESNPMGTILAGATWKDELAPTVVSFSSRGPSVITPDILKPDLTAPGVDILAAWSPVAPPSIYYADTRSVKYNIISGTSMSCPHVTGAAAFVKYAHPMWSPAAIKSALMTTAYVMDPSKNKDAEFAYGAGHINPTKAVDPGLVYNASVSDYIDFLCNQGYNSTTLQLVTGDSSKCSSTSTGKAWDLNYPSIALSVEDGQPIMGSFPRTVTNVGDPNTTYYATVQAPSSLKITVNPTVLKFSKVGQKLSFNVTLSGGVISQVPIISASIVWKDDYHVVRSPVVVYTTIPSTPDQSEKFGSVSSFHGSSMYHKNGILGGN